MDRRVYWGPPDPKKNRLDHAAGCRGTPKGAPLLEGLGPRRSTTWHVAKEDGPPFDQGAEIQTGSERIEHDRQIEEAGPITSNIGDIGPQSIFGLSAVSSEMGFERRGSGA